jgi:hypothetical protein
MKVAIYLSGLTGTLFLVFRILGILLEFPMNDLFLILGLVLLLLIFLPLIFIDRHLHDKKIKKIIDSYKGADKKTISLEKGESKTRGWGMNDSPFRDRKSGVTWGGGNIKGAEASRGTRKRFLK